MKCQYFQKALTARCCAFLGGLKLPTESEQKQFCLDGTKCLKCPTYIQKEKDVRKVA